MQGEHWVMIANFRQELYFADSLGCKGYSFLNNNNKQHYKEMIRAPLQSHPNVCGFYTIYAAFPLFKFRQEEITGVHDVNVLSFKKIYMFFSTFVCKCAVYIMFLCFFIQSNQLFQNTTKYFYIAFSQKSIRTRNILCAIVPNYPQA